MTAVLALEQVSHVYRSANSETPVLRDVSIEIAPRGLVSVEGVSGSGKSTLLALLGLLLSPTSGVVTVCGRDPAKLSHGERAAVRSSEIGFVFQSFHLLKGWTAVENVEVALLYRLDRTRARRVLAREALRAVGLEHRWAHDVTELSGGEQQRVALARAMVGRPSVLLADEPTGNLDPENSRRVRDLLRQIADEAAVVVASHDPSAAEIADVRYRLAAGRVRAVG